MTGDRIDYQGDGLSEADLADNPFDQLSGWVDAAVRRQQDLGDVAEPGALSVATVDEQGRPDVRTVLMRFLDPRGPGFVTNLGSAKGRQLRANPAVAASLTWPAMFRAIRFRGVAESIPDEEVTTYFQHRPWGARVSAWASDQSRPVASRAALEEAFARYAERYPDHGRPGDVPVPPEWGAFRIVPDRVEFWGGRRNRLHDRLVFDKVGEGDLAQASCWQVGRLQP